MNIHEKQKEDNKPSLVHWVLPINFLHISASMDIHVVYSVRAFTLQHVRVISQNGLIVYIVMHMCVGKAPR